MNNLEKLQQESDHIRTSLDALYQETILAKQKEKKQELFAQAEKAKQQAELLLQTEKDSNARAKLEEIKKQLEDYSSELQALSAKVKEQIQPEEGGKRDTSNDVKATDAVDSLAPEKKNFLEKGIDWIKGDENEEHHTAKAIGRGALVASGIGIGIYGLGKFFWRWGKKEEKSESSEGNEAKPKKKSRWKKALAWGAGIFGGTWLGRGLITGKRDLFGWNPFKNWKEANAKDGNSEKHQSYENFIKDPENKEKAENYESFGNNIDATYQALYDEELKAGYQDELEMERISKLLNKEKKYKGVVPFCLDKQYESVEEILYQNTNFKSILNWGVHQMKTYIQNLAADQLQVFVDSYLSKLPSRWILEGFKGSLKEKIDKWVLENQQSKEELQYFFRQGIRVQTYLFEKRDQLKQKVIEKTAQAWGISPQEILKDEEKLTTALNANSDYNLFLHSLIVDATEILKRNHLFDDKLGEHVQETVKQLDEQRAEVLGVQAGEKDILQTINEKTDENLTENEKNQLASSCDKIIKDVDEGISEAVEASMWNVYWDLFASKDSFIRKYFSKAGLQNAFNTIKQTIREKQVELKNGNLSLEKTKALATTINNLLAMKKEIILGVNTLEREEGENGTIFYRIPWFAKGSWDNFLKGFSKLVSWNWIMERFEGVGNILTSLLGVGATVTVVWGVVTSIIFGTRTGAKVTLRLAKTTLAPAYLVWKWAWEAGKRFRPIQRLSNKMLYATPNRVLWWMKFGWENGPDELIKTMKLGHISLNDAADIVKRKTNWRFSNSKIRENWLLKFDLSEKTLKTTEYSEKVFDQFLSSTKMGDSYLQTLKSDRALYKKIIENFDRSPRIMEAIRGDLPVNELRKIVDEVENIHKNLITQTKKVAEASAKWVAESILESNSYKALNLEFENTFRMLNKDLASASDAKKLQIQKQIDHLEFIKKNFAMNKTQAEIDQLFNFYKEYNKLVPNKSIANLDTLGKMLSKNLPELEKALKELDIAALRKLKSAGHFDDLGDEAFEWVIKMLDDLKIRKMNGVKLFKNGDEMLDGIKAFVKILTKST